MSYLRNLYNRNISKPEDVLSVFVEINQQYTGPQLRQLIGKDVDLPGLITYFEDKIRRGEYTKMAKALDNIMPETAVLHRTLDFTRNGKWDSLEEFETKFKTMTESMLESYRWYFLISSLKNILTAYRDTAVKGMK